MKYVLAQRQNRSDAATQRKTRRAGERRNWAANDSAYRPSCCLCGLLCVSAVHFLTNVDGVAF